MYVFGLVSIPSRSFSEFRIRFVISSASVAVFVLILGRSLLLWIMTMTTSRCIKDHLRCDNQSIEESKRRQQRKIAKSSCRDPTAGSHKSEAALALRQVDGVLVDPNHTLTLS